MAGAAALASCQNAESAGREAMRLHAKDQFAAAGRLYRQAAEQDPGDPRWHYYLGDVQLTLKQNAEAVESLRRVKPATLASEVRLARALFEAGDVEGSAQAASAALAFDRGSAEAEYWLGRALLAKGGHTGIEHLKRACNLAPAYGAAHYALAIALRDSGQREASEAAFQRHRANLEGAPPRDDPMMDEIDLLREDSALEQVRRGVMAEQAGRLADAARFQRRALELDPNFAQAHSNLVALYGRLGQPADAERHYRAALALNPNLAELHYNHGSVLAGQNRLDEAETAYSRVLEINPHRADALLNLGLVLERQGRGENAEAKYREAIAAQPNFRLAYFHLGKWMVARNRHREAIEPLLQAVRGEGESNALFWYGLATAYRGAGDTAHANETARRGRELAELTGQRELAGAIAHEFPGVASRR